LPHFFYIARCCDNSLYSGYTVNLEKRETQHNLGKGAKYTAARKPVKIIYSEEFESKSAAMQREAEVKSWKREAKEKLLRKKSV